MQENGLLKLLLENQYVIMRALYAQLPMPGNGSPDLCDDLRDKLAETENVLALWGTGFPRG